MICNRLQSCGVLYIEAFSLRGVSLISLINKKERMYI